MSETNKFSRNYTQNEGQPAAKAMLYAIGLDDNDMKKAQVGIASTGYEGNPCNMHLNDLSVLMKKGIQEAGLVGLIFHTIGVSDGMTNGTPGMRYSLVSREIIADSIETVVAAQYYDAVVAVVGCDKNMPGSLIAMARLDRPAIMVYGGTIKPGHYKGEDLNIVSAFEAYGQKLRGTIGEEDYNQIIRHCIPGAGACGGMYTANTMASAIEAMGMALPFTSSNPAISPEKANEGQRVGEAIKLLLERDLKPSDIMTKAAFENALRIIMVLGGSTNAVLHMVAMARTVGVDLGIDDFQRISDQTPFLADLKPSGKYLMEDLFRVGGVPAVMKMMLAEGLLDGSCMTVTGKTVAKNLQDVSPLSEGQTVIHPVSNPIKETGHIQILYGNLAPDGAVAKITGKEGMRFQGRARVYDNEYDAITGIHNEVQKGEVIVIRYEGPKGAPGMPEMLKPTGAVMGAGLGKDVALITDGRFSGGSHGFVVGHITPEAQEGGAIALIENGDLITIDAEKREIRLEISDAELAARRSRWTKPPYKEKTGVLRKYINQVRTASEGCLTDR